MSMWPRDNPYIEIELHCLENAIKSQLAFPYSPNGPAKIFGYYGAVVETAAKTGMSKQEFDNRMFRFFIELSIKLYGTAPDWFWALLSCHQWLFGK